ncbi:hypothetical protein EYF80_062883 [Liparis tanakae]|uniref:Uncharacterized protein n=1 Tax=Liparis tanakae TaxID=230148 RepID=A0A4Z2EEQ6_9TELE|nr:hypothetical protein EYF80_062883 [Liparis tanakae]
MTVTTTRGRRREAGPEPARTTWRVSPTQRSAGWRPSPETPSWWTNPSPT